MAIGHAIDRGVVHQDVLVVRGPTHVNFGIIHSRIDRVLQRSQRVFVCTAMIPSVRNDHEIVLGNWKLGRMDECRSENH
jgi:hypothetical protein